MRLMPLLILALLLIGFSSRPSVVAALSAGHLLIEVASETIVLDAAGDSETRMTAAAGADIRITVAKCVPLAILPCAPLPVRQRASSEPVLRVAAGSPPGPVFRFLRPPQA